MGSDPWDGLSVDLLSPAKAVGKVTKDDTQTYTGARSVLCGSAGTANITDAEGNDHDNFPLQQGYNPVRVTKIRTGGTASDIWVLY